VEIFLSSTVSILVQQDLGVQVNPSRLAAEDPLDLLKHHQNLHWGHAAIIVVITKLEQQFDLLVLGVPRQQVDTDQEVQNIGIPMAVEAAVGFDDLRSEPLEHGLDQLLSRGLLGEDVLKALVELYVVKCR